MPDPNPVVPRSALRLVLFGMPDAGKSSLLGALAQAAQAQEHALNGRLTDVGQGLAELQHRLYDGAPRETLEEVAPFVIVFESFAGRPPERLDAVLIDCDGRVANDLLSRRRALEERGQAGLGAAVLSADAIVLAVDASASPAQVEADFTEFARFLRLLEVSRGQRTEVGGLPVFLVLTKCDLLARPRESVAAWMDRMEERKGQVGQRFREFLARDPAPLPFGSIDLHLWATAVKRPELEGSPARPREPYGVAELFRQAFDEARAFRQRRQRSGRRLFWTVLGTAGVVAAMGGLAALLVVNRPAVHTSELEARVDHWKAREQDQPPAARYQTPQAKIDELTLLANSPSFAELSEDRRAFVENRLRELRAYLQFAQQAERVPDPADARNETELDAIRDRLDKIEIPEGSRSEWGQAPAGQRLAELRRDLDALAEAVRYVRSSYEKLIQDGRRVLSQKNEPNLPRRAKEVLEKARVLPDPRADRGRPVPGSPRVTYATVFEFAGVDEVVQQWESDIRRKLEPAAKLDAP